jgi:lipoteichoic acid synthase
MADVHVASHAPQAGRKLHRRSQPGGTGTTLLPAVLGAAVLVGVTCSAAHASADCGIKTLVIEAAGTELDGPPRFEVLLDGKPLGQFDVSGAQSHASTADQSMAELKAAAEHSTPFNINLGGVADPKVIEVRFLNDKWGGTDKPGDRNLFIKSVIVNGTSIPQSQMKADAPSHGLTDQSGTALYENGSLLVTGPFVAGCK